MRWLLVVLVALAAACGDDNGASDGGLDGGLDLAAPSGCPATAPAHVACSPLRATCTYANAYCVCDATTSLWYCADPSCANASGGRACPTPGQQCILGEQTSVICVGPENVWVQCGGLPICYTNGLCCGNSSCVTITGATCACNANHVDCGADGGM